MFSRSKFGLHLIIGLCMVGTVRSMADPPAPLPPAEMAHYRRLEAKKMKRLRGHHQLAEYIALRGAVLQDNPPSPQEAIVHYGLKSLGTPFTLRAKMFDLVEADCVTWSERVIALALTDRWADAYRLQFRLRFKDGQRRFANLNQYPIADWMPNNAWLFDDVTERMGAQLDPMDVVTDRLAMFTDHTASVDPNDPALSDPPPLSGPEVSLVTKYIRADDAATALPRLRSGDLVLFIADHIDPRDRVQRPHCIHQAIVRVVGTNVRLLHCLPPEAVESQFHLFVNERIPRDRYLGFKVLRLKPNARELVGVELAQMTTTMRTPAEMDRRIGKRGLGRGGMVMATPGRPPDREFERNDVVYGAIDVALGETLYSLFRGRWQHIYNHPANAAFRAANPDPHNLTDGPEEIFFPLRDADE